MKNLVQLEIKIVDNILKLMAYTLFYIRICLIRSWGWDWTKIKKEIRKLARLGKIGWRDKIKQEVFEPKSPPVFLTHTEDDSSDYKALGEYGVLYTYKRRNVRTYNLSHVSHYALAANPLWLPLWTLGSLEYLSPKLSVPGAESRDTLCSRR